MNTQSTYRYFVSFSHDRGFGQTEVTLSGPVRSNTEVKAMADAISARRPSPVVIINYTLMSGPNTAPGIAAIAERLGVFIDRANAELRDETADRQVIVERLVFALASLRAALTPS